MIAYRALIGLVVVVTALLLQATVVGPVAVFVPVSLALVVVLSVALLSGPGTGIALGFGAGLLADLSSSHAVGTLALTWMVGGLLAGRASGVVAPGASVLPANRRIRRRIDRRRIALRLRQGVVVGVLGGAVAAATTVLEQAVGAPVDALSTALVRCLPAMIGDALLALLVLPLVGRVLASAPLRPRTGARPSVAHPPTFPLAAP